MLGNFDASKTADLRTHVLNLIFPQSLKQNKSGKMKQYIGRVILAARFPFITVKAITAPNARNENRIVRQIKHPVHKNNNKTIKRTIQTADPTQQKPINTTLSLETG